jgi:anaerobic dimethyl sulfoxide reductase subunit A
LPIIKSGEREDFFSLMMSGIPGVMYSHPLIKPLWECKDDQECWGLVAKKAGLGGVWQDNFTPEDSVRMAVGVARMLEPKLPSIEEMRKNPEKAIVKNPFQNVVSLTGPYSAQINHGAPFGTASGKWEIYSETIERMVNVPAQRNLWWLPNDYPGMKDMMKRTPPIPAWIDHWEGPLDPIASKYPFQMSSPASIRNAHNSFINNTVLDDVWGPQVVWIHTDDAAERGIKNGDIVQVFNDRGAIQVRAFVTGRIAKGVIALENGRPAAFSKGSTGVDINGAQSTLLRDREFLGMMLPHAGAFLSNEVTHTGRVDVRKVAEAPAFQGDPREPGSEGGPWIPNYPFSIDGKDENIETVNADPESEAFWEGATWNREKSQGKTADKNVQGYVSQGAVQTKK